MLIEQTGWRTAFATRDKRADGFGLDEGTVSRHDDERAPAHPAVFGKRFARGTDSVDGNVRATLGPAPGPQLVGSRTLSTRALARCSRGNDRYASL